MYAKLLHPPSPYPLCVIYICDLDENEIISALSTTMRLCMLIQIARRSIAFAKHIVYPLVDCVNGSFEIGFNFVTRTQQNRQKETAVNCKTDSIKSEVKRKFLQKCVFVLLFSYSWFSILFSLFLLISTRTLHHQCDNAVREDDDDNDGKTKTKHTTMAQQIEQLSRAFYGFVPYLFCDALSAASVGFFVRTVREAQQTKSLLHTLASDRHFRYSGLLENVSIEM